MDGYHIFLILLAVYLSGLVGIGWYFNKKQKSVTDFWLAGREIGPKAIGGVECIFEGAQEEVRRLKK